VKILGYVFGVFFTTCLICGAAFATPVPTPTSAPAPLLAAGIPAFAALGGGVVVTKFLRRFRSSK
jgi:hypothetical protein